MKALPIIISLALLVPSAAVFAESGRGSSGDAIRSEQSGLDDSTEREDESNDTEDNDRVAASTTTMVRSDDRGSDDENESNDDRGGRSATSTERSEKGKSMAEEHRSAVASFVKSLLEDADRDGGIGAEVREVARSQNETASTSVEAIERVEKRSGWKTFFLGTDWKSIGALRASIATTTADISRLERARERATDSSVKADLEAQIEALKENASSTEAFVKQHESAFSLFGWLTRIFSK